jgi:protein-S-isoprenylcysteine O-methyltransferase Ste14
VLIPKTKREIWLNRVRVWLPPVFVVVALALGKPTWHVWGIPLVVLGEAVRTWAAGHLLKDEQLTTTGPYAHVRNPLYLGSLLSGIGFLVVLGDWRLAAAFLVVALAVYLPTVRQEEDYLRRMHGEVYEEYRRKVPGLVPRLRRGDPLRSPVPALRGFAWCRVVLNKEHLTWAALVALFALLALRARL